VSLAVAWPAKPHGLQRSSGELPPGPSVTGHWTPSVTGHGTPSVTGHGKRRTGSAARHRFSALSLRWDDVRWDHVRWDHVRWDHVRWDHVRWDHVRWDHVRCGSLD
jgi:hypothetical protein